MRTVKIFFAPFLLVISWFYRTIVEIRNLLYDVGFYKSVNFETPIISVGNISIGGIHASTDDISSTFDSPLFLNKKTPD